MRLSVILHCFALAVAPWVGLSAAELPDSLAIKQGARFTWDFENGNEGWSNSNSISSLHAADGCLRGLASGSDPYVYDPNMKLAIKGSAGVAVRVLFSSSATLQLYWANEDGDFSEARQVNTTVPGNQWTTVWFDLASHPGWAEKTLKKIRLDPGDSGVTFYIEHVSILDEFSTPDLPYVSGVTDFASGLEGWTQWDVADFRGQDGKLMGRSSGGDPHVVSGAMSYSGQGGVMAHIKSSHPCDVKLFWATTFVLGGALLANPGLTAWGYDGLGQVVSAAAPGTDADRGYIYDAIGNRRGQQVGATSVPTNAQGEIVPNPGTTSYTANALNQYAGEGAISGVLNANPVFDDDGNMKIGPLSGTGGSAANHLYWDAENRLVEVRAADNTTVVATYDYDSQSRRIARTQGAATTLYLYDSFNCIAEYTGGTGVSPTLNTTRLWGIDLSGTLQSAGGVGGMLAERHHSGTAATFYPTFDGNGNVSEYLDATGSPVAHFEYDPFGNTVVNTDGSDQFSYRFSTKPLDFVTGLYYYQYRYYDPLTGRWPSRDPIGEDGGINLYGFVGNNGVNSWDYLGQLGPLVIPIGGAAIVLTAADILGISACACLISPPCLELVAQLTEEAAEAARRAACEAGCSAAFTVADLACLRFGGLANVLCRRRAADDYADCLLNCK